MAYSSLARAQLESQEGWHEAIISIPAIRFPASWSIRIIPPFAGALARFIVTRGNATVSVYADFHEALGYFGAPHWECYPGGSGENERFEIGDTAGLLAAIQAGLNRQRPRLSTPEGGR